MTVTKNQNEGNSEELWGGWDEAMESVPQMNEH